MLSIYLFFGGPFFGNTTGLVVAVSGTIFLILSWITGVTSILTVESFVTSFLSLSLQLVAITEVNSSVPRINPGASLDFLIIMLVGLGYKDTINILKFKRMGEKIKQRAGTSAATG